jgi:hypothetical protein
MLLSELINAFKTVALKHKDIESFDMGDDYLIEGNVVHQYPKFFLETPFQIIYPQDRRLQYYTVSFAFLVLMNKLEDNIDDQIQGVSDSALITEQILAKIRLDYATDIQILTAVSLTYNDMTNEGLSTTRTDITCNILLNQCTTALELSDIFTK